VATVLAGLTLAQLRWIFTSFTDAQLAATGLDLAAVVGRCRLNR